MVVRLRRAHLPLRKLDLRILSMTFSGKASRLNFTRRVRKTCLCHETYPGSDAPDILAWSCLLLDFGTKS